VNYTELLGQIATFSDRLALDLKIERTRSLWVGDKFAATEPHQFILHYTASPFFYGNVRWFLQDNLDARVSAHYLVADRWDAITGKLAKGLPLVQALPVPIAEIVEPDRVAWHATVANRHAIGIEIVNAGPVKALRQAKNAVHNCRSGGTFTPYAAEQIEATKQLIAELHRVPVVCVDPADILGHEHVQQNKVDPGPLFPVDQVRAQFCADETVSRFAARDWFYEFDGAMWLHTLAHTNPHLDAELPKVLLAAMGFHVTRNEAGIFEASKKTIVAFQQLMGLAQDGVIGPKTKAALTQRWADVAFVGTP
jgi:N-acetyl-anhydromuramyl-L-alanine amidase AmpD